MAISFKFGLLPTTYTKGSSSSRYDRARLHVRVKGIAPNNANLPSETTAQTILKQAADEFLRVYPRYFYQDSSLPLIRVTVQRWGTEHVWLIADYGRGSTGIIVPGIVLVDTRPGKWATRWYRSSAAGASQSFDSDGMPGGDIYGNADIFDASSIPTSRQIVLGTLEIFVRCRTTRDPNFTVGLDFSQYNNTVNQFSYTIGGRTIGARKLLWNGVSAHEDYDSSTQTSMYDLVYSFTACRNRFWFQDCRFGPGFNGQFPTQPAGGTEVIWRTQKVLAYPEAAWPNLVTQ